MTEDYRKALLDLAAEFDAGLEYERELALRNFPCVGVDFLGRCAHRGEVFQQLATMLRERTAQRTGDEVV